MRSPPPASQFFERDGPYARIAGILVCIPCSPRVAPQLVVTLFLLLTTSAFSANTSPLVEAAEKSDLSTIRTLLKRQADVDAPQADGMTALHWAVYHGDMEAVKILLQNKANITATNRYG